MNKAGRRCERLLSVPPAGPWGAREMAIDCLAVFGIVICGVSAAGCSLAAWLGGRWGLKERGGRPASQKSRISDCCYQAVISGSDRETGYTNNHHMDSVNNENDMPDASYANIARGKIVEIKAFLSFLLVR